MEKTPLHICALIPNLATDPIASILVKEGANVNARDKKEILLYI